MLATLRRECFALLQGRGDGCPGLLRPAKGEAFANMPRRITKGSHGECLAPTMVGGNAFALFGFATIRMGEAFASKPNREAQIAEIHTAKA